MLSQTVIKNPYQCKCPYVRKSLAESDRANSFMSHRVNNIAKQFYVPLPVSVEKWHSHTQHLKFSAVSVSPLEIRK
jgi:ssDNA-specific exonuclease RecJ